MKLIDLGGVYRMDDRRQPDLRDDRLPGPRDRPARARRSHRTSSPSAARWPCCAPTSPATRARTGTRCRRPGDVPLYPEFDSLLPLPRAGDGARSRRCGSRPPTEMAAQLLGVLREIVAVRPGSPTPGGPSTMFTARGAWLDRRADWRALPTPLVDPDDPARRRHPVARQARAGRRGPEPRRRTQPSHVGARPLAGPGADRPGRARRGRRRAGRSRGSRPVGVAGVRGTGALAALERRAGDAATDEFDAGATARCPASWRRSSRSAWPPSSAANRRAAAALVRDRRADRPGVHVGGVRPRPVPRGARRPRRRRRRARRACPTRRAPTSTPRSPRSTCCSTARRGRPRDRRPAARPRSSIGRASLDTEQRATAAGRRSSRRRCDSSATTATPTDGYRARRPAHRTRHPSRAGGRPTASLGAARADPTPSASHSSTGPTASVRGRAVSTDLDLRCPSCGEPTLRRRRVLRVCGLAVAEPRDRRATTSRLDAGRLPAVSDRGLVHERNEDALFVRVEVGGRVRTVAVVCDGVSTSAAPQVAAQVAADVDRRASRRAATGPDGHASTGRPS